MQANGFRKSAVAMMMVAGGLAAAVSSYAPAVQAQANKGSQTAIPCNLSPKEKRARKSAKKVESIPGPLGAKKKSAIPCDTRKSAKKAAIPCDLRKSGKGRAIPCNGVRATKKGGAMNPCELKK